MREHRRFVRRFIWVSAALAASMATGSLECGVPAGFVTRQGTSFVSDGLPFPAVGFNSYYLMVYAAEPSLRSTVDEVLREAKTLGATVVRTWAYNDGADEWNALQRSPGVYDERVFAGLDYVVRRAGDEGLKLILVFVGNWDDYGGMNQYVEWSPSASEHDDFYTDANTRTWYRDHVRRVVTRVNTFTGRAYRDDPAIFAWELANEPRAARAGAAVLNAWVGEMADYVKSLDPAHMVSTGSEGFYGPGQAGRNPASWMSREGVDFLAQHAPESIDFASLHIWPDNWNLGSNLEAMAAWLRRHLDDAQAVLQKPLLAGEFGKRQPIATRDQFFSRYYDEVLAALGPGDSRAGLLCWILYHDAYPDYDGYGVYYPSADHASTTALIASKHAEIASRLEAVERFRRADANCDGTVDVSDPVATLFRLFAGSASVCCLDAADSNDSGSVDLSDAIYTLRFTFSGGAAPPAPFPDCGPDPTGDSPVLECTNRAACP
jgi:mannan endo-1,4-beta-mannosidase